MHELRLSSDRPLLMNCKLRERREAGFRGSHCLSSTVVSCTTAHQIIVQREKYSTSSSLVCPLSKLSISIRCPAYQAQHSDAGTLQWICNDASNDETAAHGAEYDWIPRPSPVRCRILVSLAHFEHAKYCKDPERIFAKTSQSLADSYVQE